MATKSKSELGPARWTYSLAAVVGAAGLMWAIVSYFIPKPDPLKPPAAVVIPSQQGDASVDVSGSGSVGVGNMSGGTIGVAAPVPALPASVTK